MAEKGITEDIAEKVVDLISDAKEVSSLSSIARSLQNQTRQLSAEIGKLGKRMENLENRAENLGNNFKTFAVEADRIISEKTNEMEKENDETITKLLTEMQDLRDIVIELKRNAKVENTGKIM